MKVTTRSANSAPRVAAPNLRERRKREGMRRVQDAALDLFDEHGFDGASVDDVARAADVGTATVYRWFSTKERLVLWDDYDPDLFAGIAARLPGSIVDAVESSIVSGLGAVYAGDKKRILRRARLMLRTPALQAAAAADRHAFRRVLAELLTSTKSCKDALEADVVAAAVAGAVEAAIDHWVAGKGRDSLDLLFRQAFARLRALC